MTKSKKQLLIATGHHLFWKHGIKRVSIEEICKEAGVSKMTFYRNFENKIVFAKEVLKHVFDEMEKKYDELMAQDIPFSEKIKIQVQLKFEGTKEISSELIKDIYSGSNDELQTYFNGYAKKMTTKVRNDYALAIEKGFIRKNVQLDFIFYISQKMTEMASDPQLLALYENPQGLIMEFMNMLFYGIIPREND